MSRPIWALGLAASLLAAAPLQAADDSSILDFYFPALNAGSSSGSPSPPIDSTGCTVPDEAKPEDTSSPDIVIGDGTPASCTSDAVVAAVAQGGVITFDCGASPVTITMEETAKVFNNANPDIVIDGGGKVTLSGAEARRILYMNTCDKAQVYTTSHCQNQDHPRLTVQNLHFTQGFQDGESGTDGGGAIFVRGGRFKIINCQFTANRCADTGTDVGGAAVRVFSQYEGLPVYVVDSTFGGSEAKGNRCANGGALSSIGTSYTVIDSLFSYNQAIGIGANSGSPGGGNGGAIYNDGNTFTLDVCGSTIEHNTANEGGGGIFYVSNDRTGTIRVVDSTLRDNTSLGGWDTHPGMFILTNQPIVLTGSVIE
jgi:hypothetical protein